MRIRIFAIATAALALTAQAAPAHADELDAVMGVVNGIDMLASPSHCRWFEGVQRRICEVRQIKARVEYTQRHANRLVEGDGRRGRDQRRSASTRATALRQCSDGNQYVCDQLNMAPQQASYILSRTR